MSSVVPVKFTDDFYVDKNVAVKKVIAASDNISYNRIASNSGAVGGTSINFPDQFNGQGTHMSRRWIVEVPVSLTIQWAAAHDFSNDSAGKAAVKRELPNRVALRQCPINASVRTGNLRINNETITQRPIEYLRDLFNYFLTLDDTDGILSTTAMMPDYYAYYRDGVYSNMGGLAGFTSSTREIARGAFVPEVEIVDTTTIRLKYSLIEPVMFGPLQYRQTDDSAAFKWVQKYGLTLDFEDVLGNMFSLRDLQGIPASGIQTISNVSAAISGVCHLNVTFKTPTALVESNDLNQYIQYDHFERIPGRTGKKVGLNANPQSITIDSDQTTRTKIPNYMIISANNYDQKVSNPGLKRAYDTDTYLPIDFKTVYPVRLNMGGMCSLDRVTHFQLYTIMRQNGFKRNYHVFKGQALGARSAGPYDSPTDAQGEISLAGSPLMLRAGVDFPLTRGQVPGMNFMQNNVFIQATFDNNRRFARFDDDGLENDGGDWNSPYGQLYSASLNIIFSDMEALELSPGSARKLKLDVTAQDLLSTTGNVTLTYGENMIGGFFGVNPLNPLKRAIKGAPDFFSKLFSGDIKGALGRVASEVAENVDDLGVFAENVAKASGVDEEFIADIGRDLASQAKTTVSDVARRGLSEVRRAVGSGGATRAAGGAAASRRNMLRRMRR